MSGLSEGQKQGLVHSWYGQRIQAIHNRVTVYDVLRRNNVDLKYDSEDRAEQISCPFHGIDEHPSAKVFPESNDSPSHVWCFVCQERWDVISLWKKYSGSDKKFGAILSEIEKAYNIDTPEFPRELRAKEIERDAKQEARDLFNKRLKIAESRMKSRRSTFQDLGLMSEFLLLGSVLDKVTYRVSKDLMNPSSALKVVEDVLQRITEKERLTGGSESETPDS